MHCKRLLKALAAEALRLLVGIIFVAALSIATLHLIGTQSSALYTYLCMACMLSYSLLWCALLLRFRCNLTPGHAFSSGLAVCCASAVLLVIVPLAVNRSTTLFLLREMQESSGATSQEKLEKRFIQRFICEQGAVMQRLEEQRISGAVLYTPEGYALSTRGEKTAQVVAWLTWLFAVPPHPSERGDSAFCAISTKRAAP